MKTDEGCVDMEEVAFGFEGDKYIYFEKEWFRSEKWKLVWRTLTILVV